MDTERHPYREFEITIKGKVGSEAFGSGDFGLLDLVTETEIETSLGEVIGTPPNVEGAIELYERIQRDGEVLDMIRLDLPVSIHNALVSRSRNG